MLALARSEGQSIIIDGHIEVKVVKWSRSSVRLAIQAPREVRVDRDETWRKMHPGELTPLEVAEKERNERFAREGGRGPVEGETLINARVAGVFASGPAGGPAFVAIGSAVSPQMVVGMIKAADGTELPVNAPLQGSIVRVLVQNGQTVAAGEGLFVVRGLPESGNV